MKSYVKLVLLLSLFATSCADKKEEVIEVVEKVEVVEEVVAKVEAPKIPTVTPEQQTIYKRRIIDLAAPKLEEFIGDAFFAGFLARKQGFQSSERVELENIKLGAFKCKYHDPSGKKSAAEFTNVWCHFYANFYFKDVAETEKIYKNLLKVKMNAEGEPEFAPVKTFRTLLTEAFVTKDPIANNKKFQKHFPNLKEGRLSIGMPEEFLRVCWGNPKHVVDFEITESGRRETYVYRDYFVVLKNKVVSSVHRFNDVKTAGL